MVGIQIIWARDRVASRLAGPGNGWHPDWLDTGMVGIRKWLGPGTVGIRLFSEPECLTRKD